MWSGLWSGMAMHPLDYVFARRVLAIDWVAARIRAPPDPGRPIDLGPTGPPTVEGAGLLVDLRAQRGLIRPEYGIATIGRVMPRPIEV